MLTAEGCAARREELRARAGDYDLLLVSQPHHIFYLTGFLVRPTDLASQGLHFLLIDREGQARLVVDNWAGEAARAAFADEVDEWPWYDFVHSPAEKLSAAVEALARSLAAHHPKHRRVGLEHAHLPTAAFAALGRVDWQDLGAELEAMRLSKGPDELECIRRAVRAVEAGHAAAREEARPGLTELELYAEVEGAITRAAGEPILMLCDFAAGQRSEAGGGPPTANVLRKGDLLILDLFPLIGGYRADFTNTLCVGEPTQEQRDLMETLKEALRAGEALLRPGATGGQVYEACRAALVGAGVDGLPHHAGHGLGLGHPEAPYFVPESRDVLQAGNVVTLEPGAYRPGWGGARIEHNYLITPDGFERLSNHVIGL
jgi:Xaa-Pro aminopeptidase